MDNPPRNVPLSHRQAFLLRRYNTINVTIKSLQDEKKAILKELNGIIPSLPLSVPPKLPGTVLTIFNYAQHNDSCTINITRSGIKALSSLDLPLSDLAILSLALEFKGVDADFLLQFPPLLVYHPRPAHRVHQLQKQGLITLDFQAN